MAKLRDQMMAIAEHRAAKAEIAVPTCVKEFATRMEGIRELRNGQGKVYKVVGLLRCRAVVAGRSEPIETEMELAAGNNWGVAGEISQCFKPALEQFLSHVTTVFMGQLKEQEKPLDPTQLPPLPSERPVSEYHLEKARNWRAASQVKPKTAGRPGLPPTTPPPAYEEGGEIDG